MSHMLRSEKMEWKEFLMKVEKEQLVDILIGKMVRDTYFHKEVYNEFVKEKISNGTATVDQAIESYGKEVKEEFEASVRSANYLMSISYDLLEQCENVCIIDQIKIHMAILKELGNALNYGAGYEDESDAFVSDILMDSEKEVVNILNHNLEKFTQDEWKALYHILEDASQDKEMSYFVKKLHTQFSFDFTQ